MIHEDFQYALFAKRVEPQERVHCTSHVPRGQRNLPEPARHHGHRFPIKGGINLMSLMAKNISNNNALLKRLRSNAK